MSFPICKVMGEPKFDILPVIKITDYPLEKRDYKPFAQCRIAVNEAALYLQLWAFEAKPEPMSQLQAVLYLHPKAEDPVVLTLQADGEAWLRMGDQAIPVEQYQVHPFRGDDLQGKYWGATVTLPLSLLEQLGETALQSGSRLAGNFYKLCSGEHPHKGSFTPVSDWTAPLSPTAMGTLIVTEF